jgi:hypothetical protein
MNDEAGEIERQWKRLADDLEDDDEVEPLDENDLEQVYDAD